MRAAVKKCSAAVLAAVLSAMIVIPAQAEVIGRGHAAVQTTAAAGETAEAALQIANPWTECASLEEAEAKAGFTFGIPTTADGYHVRAYRVIPGTMLEVILDGETGDILRLRKSKGKEDNSGDDNEYPQNISITIYGNLVRCSMDDDGIRLARWSDDLYSYSMSSAAGISIEKGTALFTDIARGVSREDAAITGEGGTLSDPQTGEVYSDRVVLINTETRLSAAELGAILEKYDLSLVYSYDMFTMYALEAAKPLDASELEALLTALRVEPKVTNAMRDGIMYLDGMNR